MSHAANPDLINRLKRAQGHLAKIVEMVSDGQVFAKSIEDLF